MSEPNQPATPTRAYPEPTQEDHDAMFASVVWFREKKEAEVYEQYKGMYVAILGEQIIDADKNKDELVRRLEAMGDALPPNRVALQYVPLPGEWNWK